MNIKNIIILSTTLHHFFFNNLIASKSENITISNSYHSSPTKSEILSPVLSENLKNFFNQTIEITEIKYEPMQISRLLDADRRRTPSPNFSFLEILSAPISSDDADTNKIKRVKFIKNHIIKALSQSTQWKQPKKHNRIASKIVVFDDILDSLPLIILNDHDAINQKIKTFFKDKRLYYNSLLLPKTESK